MKLKSQINFLNEITEWRRITGKETLEILCMIRLVSCNWPWLYASSKAFNLVYRKHFIGVLLVAWGLSSCTYVLNTSKSAGARISNFSGEKVFTIQVPDDEMHLVYHVKKVKRQVTVTIQSPSKSLLNRSFTRPEKGNFRLIDEKGTMYTIRVDEKDSFLKFKAGFQR